MYSYQLVVIGAGEKQYLQYQVENVEFLYSIFSNKQKNQIKSREKMQDKQEIENRKEERGVQSGLSGHYPTEFSAAYSSGSQMVKSHHLSLNCFLRGCLSKQIFIVVLEVVETSNQCFRTYNSGLPCRHFPVSRQVRKTAAILMVRSRHMNSRGSPGSPTAMREVSNVVPTGVMTSLMNRSGKIIFSLFSHWIFQPR